MFLKFKMWLYATWPVQKEFFAVLLGHIAAAPGVREGEGAKEEEEEELRRSKKEKGNEKKEKSDIHFVS